MPRYYCDYCDTYLTHDSPSVRKQHNAGYKHKANVRTYYQQFEEQQTQSLIDQKIKEHLGQAAAFQVGGHFNQHMMQFPGNMPRPRLPILPTPMMPHGYPQLGGQFAGVRPPILPPPGGQGYPGVPTMQQMPQPGGPPGSMPMQMAPLPRPPTLPPPTSGAPVAPMSNNSAAPPGPPPMYQPPNAGPVSGPPAPAAPPQAAFSYAQPSEGNN